MSPRRKPNKPIDIYVRVSQVRGREGDSFISPDLQEERCRAQLVADGLEAGQVFTDLDESGGKESRPAYDQALARIESGESGGVAVYKLSRFGRRVRNVLKDIAWIEEQGGTFLCVDPKIDTSTAAGRFMLTVFAALDELELDNHAAAWGEAQRRALARGAFTAQTPWGYTRNGGGQLVPDKQTARRVKQMFRKRGEGMSIANLGRWLAAEGIRSPTGGEAWSHSTIAQVLRNRIYLGEQRHGELVNTEAHKALVSRAEWEAAQVAKPVRQSEPKAHSAGALLPGLARCAGCGHTLKIVTGYGGKLRYYCKGPYTTPCPARALARVDELDGFVDGWFWQEIQGRVKTPKLVEARDRIVETREAVEAAEAELQAFLKLTSALDETLFASGLEDRRETLEAARKEHAQTLSEAQVYKGVPEGDLIARWPTLNMSAKRRLLASAFDRVVVERGNGNVARRVRFERDEVRIGP